MRRFFRSSYIDLARPRHAVRDHRGIREEDAVGLSGRFSLTQATPYPTGVVGLRYTRPV
jgi:hypothetical protein